MPIVGYGPRAKMTPHAAVHVHAVMWQRKRTFTKLPKNEKKNSNKLRIRRNICLLFKEKDYLKFYLLFIEILGFHIAAFTAALVLF